MTAPHQCWCCSRTATLGTPAEADAIDPHLCPRCDHSYMHALAGGASSFRGVDSPIFAARAPVAVAALAEVPVAWLRPAPAPAPLPKLLAACTALALGRFGAWAKLGTFDAFTWQVVCVDPCDPGVVLADHPSAVGPTPVAAADAGCVVLAGDLERVAVLLGPAHVALVDRARAEGCRYCCCTVRLGPGLLRRLGAAASERAVAALLSAHETRGAGCPVLVCLGADVACLTVELDDAPVAAIAVDAKGGDA